ncbi:MAG: hypothetical protein GY845_09425 [Planctomycetes bacterium]|nr:hypothetical protein [Planctomycetota bacterium]
MPYQTKEGYLYIPCKRGDGILGDKHAWWRRMRNGMCNGHINPRDWTIPPCLSDFSMGETLWIEIKETEANKKFAADSDKQLLNGAEFKSAVKNDNYRMTPHFIKFESLAPYVEKQYPDFLKDAFEHKKKIPVLKLDTIPEDCRGLSKDLTNVSVSDLIPDVGQITIGDYTVGPAGGDNYPTFGGAGGGYAALGNLTGLLRLINTGPITEVALATITENLNGNTFVVTSNVNQLGNPNAGHIVTINQNSIQFDQEQEGPGNVIIELLHTLRVPATNNNLQVVYNGAVVVANTVLVRYNMFDADGQGGGGIRIADADVIVQGHSNIMWDGGANGYGIRIDATDGNAANVFANNSINAHNVGLDIGNNVGMCRNNAVFNSLAFDVASAGAATGRYNYGGDASMGDGNWGAGLGNQINQVAASGWQSTTPTCDSYLDIIRGGIFDSMGEVNTLSRIDCVRGRSVPNRRGGTSVGAAESWGVTTESELIGRGIKLRDEDSADFNQPEGYRLVHESHPIDSYVEDDSFLPTDFLNPRGRWDVGAITND